MGTKMKGLLKGLRYISQIFEDDNKEPEMIIGNPTDVKHVAHIGWDGPSVNTPSWMTNFKAGPEFSTDALGITTDANSAIKWTSEESGRRSSRTTDPGRDLSEIPRPSRRATSLTDSPRKDKSDKPRQSSRRNPSRSRTNPDGTKMTSLPTLADPAALANGSDSSSSLRGDLPNIPKKSRRKKLKDPSASAGGSVRSSSRSKANDLANVSAAAYASPSAYASPFGHFSDPGTGTVPGYGADEFFESPSSPNLQPFDDGEKRTAEVS